MRKFSPALAVFLCASLLSARQEKLTCATHPDRWQEERHLHKQSERRGVKRLRRATAMAVAGEQQIAGSSVRPDAGNIAVLDDADGVVARRNPFNLNARTLRFTPSEGASKYKFELGDDSYDASAAAAGETIRDLDDDDTRELTLPFAFPFYGKQYSSVFINSDGNVSFGSGDKAVTDRSLGRFTSGAPRIAGLFTDLDPTHAATGITAYNGGDRFVVSWVKVPEYRDSGTGPLQTFQIRLFSDGRVEIAWPEITSQEAVVGITPGRLQGTPAILSFTTTASAEYQSTIAERFSGSEQIDIFAAAQKFYLNHEDAYDFLVFFNNLGIEAESDAAAYEVTLRNSRSGNGDVKVDSGADAGSTRRLQSIVNMGPLNQYPADPNARVPVRASVGDTPLTILGHEAGHLFLAYASVRDENDPRARPMLGYQGAHWHFLFNSDASLLEGNRIQDNGPGTSPRFQSIATVQGFSALDQYLMGLRAPEEVPDTFLVTNATGSRISGLPRVGAAFDGERRDIRIDEIVRAEGRRTPDHTVSQRKFRFAFVFITKAGTEPSAEELAQVETYRTAFEQFWNKATSGRSVAETSLKSALQVSTWPAAGLTLGGTATGTVSVQKAATAPVSVLLRSTSGAVEPTASVTIPAGATEASFRLTARRAGVDELIAEAAGGQFEAVSTFVQVSSPDALRLAVASGDMQAAQAGVPLANPVRIRVSDVNDVPYPGVQVSATVSEGGALEQATAVTDANGVASFRWTPAGGPENELRASITGAAPVIATALSRPAVTQNGIVSAASFAPGITPGGIGTLFGFNLAGSGTTQVLLNGQSVPVFYSSTRQVNFHVPFSTEAGTAEVVVKNGAGTSQSMTVPVSAVLPGIFFDTASGFGAITSAGTGQVTQVRPVASGESIEIYATGLGAVLESGGLSTTTAAPQVTIGGLQAEVSFSGLAPGFLGLYQVNARVPALPAGTHPLILSVSGAASNQVNIQVR